MAKLLNPKGKSPQTVPAVTLREGVVFPHTEAILSFGRDFSIQSVKKAAKDEGFLVVISQKSPDIDDPKDKDLYRVGTFCRIQKTIPVNGELHAIVRGITRVKILDVNKEEETLTATINELEQKGKQDDEFKAMIKHLINQVKKAVNLGKTNLEIPTFMRIINTSSDPATVDQVASILDIDNKEKQQILEETSLKDRLQIVLKHLSEEIEVLKLEQKIASKTQKKFDDTMKERVLRERMKMIQQELGERGSEDDQIEKFKEKIEEVNMPGKAEEKALKELDRLSKLNPHHPEYGYIRSWIETMLEFPWSESSDTIVSIDNAAKVLDQDHYGLKEVKERILEYMAVLKLKKDRSNQDEDKDKDKKKSNKESKKTSSDAVPTILCFVGPPGVGKTSVGRSIARATGRKFAKMSLGGIRDEASIRGHRRTYVGAMPGRIVQSVIDTGTNNPIIMLDEIDKVGADYRGDPSSALLEVLDPEQNSAFMDHYMDTPVDLSNIVFITTANVLDTIPPALKDRLEIIRFSGYTHHEKAKIAKNHLIDKQVKANALTKKDVAITDAALKRIIKNYTREAGVRNLERQIAKVFRKVAKKIAQNDNVDKPVKATARNLSDYLGPRKHTHTLAEEEDRVGTVTGLAYTQTGGEIIFVEVALMEGKGKLKLTGQLGDVMKESAQAAVSYVRSNAKDFDINPDRFKELDIHVHVPEGATPKDGPSAGVAITAALVSSLTDKKADRLIGMTGEISLRGRVMQIGGVKEKVIAGHRAGLKHIIMPAENKKDLEEVPDRVKKDLKFHFAENLDQVIDLAIKDK